MATTAGNAVFVDTNILVYASLPSSPFHVRADQTLNTLAANGSEFWLSRQILREWLATMSRPGTATPPIPYAQLLADVNKLASRFWIAEDNSAVFAELLTILTTTPSQGKMIHDANIVATMLTHGVTHLLTHNTADFARFAAYITVVPLIP